MTKTILFDLDGTLYDYQKADCAGVDAVNRYVADRFGLSELMDTVVTCRDHLKVIFFILRWVKIPICHTQIPPYIVTIISFFVPQRVMVWGTWEDGVSIFCTAYPP